MNLYKKIIKACTFMVILLTITVPMLANAQTSNEFFMLGNNAYKAEKYQEALDFYQDAIKSSGKSAELYYNAANAAAKLNKAGLALRYYLRAIYENPRMREAQANIEMFAKDHSIELPQRSSFSDLIVELSESEWTTLMFVSFWLAVILIFIPPLYARRTMATIFLAIVAVMFFAIGVAALSDWNAYKNNAIALKDDVALRVSPTPTAPVSAIVSEGQIGSVKNRKDKFLFIILKNGKRGWTSSEDFMPIVE